MTQRADPPAMASSRIRTATMPAVATMTIISMIISNTAAFVTSFTPAAQTAARGSQIMFSLSSADLSSFQRRSSPKSPLSRPQMLTVMEAKKSKKKKNRAAPAKSGTGFGAPASPTIVTTDVIDDTSDDVTTDVIAPTADSPPSKATPLKSIDSPTTSPTSSLSPEERSEQILREKFGLRSFEEQQGDIELEIQSRKKKETRNKLRNIDKLWPEDKDLFAVLPPPLLRAVDTFLKVGLGISTVVFVGAGVLITVEAWSKATSSELPDGLSDLIVDVVEPNFTPGLGILLLFSVSLGLFSAAQLGSSSSTYREDP